MIDTRDFLEKVMGLHTRPVEARGRIIVAETETKSGVKEGNMIQWAEDDRGRQEREAEDA